MNWHGDFATFDAAALAGLSRLRTLRLSHFYGYNLGWGRREAVEQRVCGLSQRVECSMILGEVVQCHFFSWPGCQQCGPAQTCV